MEKERKRKFFCGRIYCKGCNVTLSEPKYRKYFREDFGILCDFCENSDIDKEIIKKIFDNFDEDERVRLRKLVLERWYLCE